MAQSDITIDALSKVGQQDAEYLVSLVRSVPGFPKEGIIFRDFMPVLADPKGLKRIRLHCRSRIARVPVRPGHGRPFGQGFHRRA